MLRSSRPEVIRDFHITQLHITTAQTHPCPHTIVRNRRPTYLTPVGSSRWDWHWASCLETSCHLDRGLFLVFWQPGSPAAEWPGGRPDPVDLMSDDQVFSRHMIGLILIWFFVFTKWSLPSSMGPSRAPPWQKDETESRCCVSAIQAMLLRACWACTPPCSDGRRPVSLEHELGAQRPEAGT